MTVSKFAGGVCLAAIALMAMPAAAQDQRETQDSGTATAETQDQDARASDIIVNGDIVFRNRTSDPNPVLAYDLEYFQRFEPVSVGEMLKRVPGTTFTSDVLEYDQVQFRGLPPGFTQVLINGRRAPGGEADRSFFVDRIPAELVERIEIVRAPRADQPSEGVAGTLNIVTKESTAFEGGFVKAAALINADGGVRPSAAIAYAGRLGADTDFWAALNYQKRRNPKRKVSFRFGDEPTTGEPYNEDPEFSDFEAQDDTRDGSDLSGSAEIVHRFGDGGRFRIGGFFVDTDRKESEVSATFEGADLDFDEVEVQEEDINQQTYSVTSDAVIPLGAVELGLAGGWSAYREDTAVQVFVGDNEDDFTDVELDDEETLDIKDDEFNFTAFLRYGNDTPVQLKTGIDLLFKKRTGRNVGDFIADDFPFEVKEDRYDPYVRLTFEPSSDFTIDAGLRYEITKRSVTADGDVADYDTDQLNPSLHLRYAPTDADQFRASVARTVRRPNYNLISPYLQEESPGDDDETIGNPALLNESAWGLDVGYERRLGRNGIFGVNFFYRDISDLTELVAIGDSSNGLGQLFTPRNIGDGQTWGFEADFSAPLDVIGLPDTGLFANYTYLDSRTTDPFTGEKRQFNNQPHHLYNIGFIQTLRAADASFGATISGRSRATESNFDEVVDLRYDPDLEAFVEKRLGGQFVLRFTVQNILNRRKKEDFRKYDGDSFEEILDNRAAGDLDEYEIERERSGQLFQVTLRAAF
ncbi:TonB-dependent receptor [Sphingomonas sp. BGYR3]|uniref:TonB-dependent receptor plug domain-containing protein n=1 Tax=Sphingomonas sp. BGYR3 TaxID=2975483 RepID=UPI0021A62D31|nr:TonB-dependent receptor [Sphingomonas sp. BGYR3]MDG5487652.1 TonB-dependent receptor [Sphingomonas sp. BGYR3]